MRMVFMLGIAFIGPTLHAQHGVPELGRSSDAGQRLFNERFRRGGNTNDMLVVHRLEYLRSLRVLIDERIWPGFNDRGYSAPLIYYAGSATFLMDPTPAAITAWKAVKITSPDGMPVYKSTQAVDPETFRMVTSFTMGDTAAFDDMEPFMHATGAEETRRFHDDVTSTELWATMVLHEYFHAFQFKHPEHLAHFVEQIITTPEDTLRATFTAHEWFQDLATQENEVLLKAIGSDDRKEVHALLTEFLQIRKDRRDRLWNEVGFAIEAAEKAFETKEGTARYIELRLYQVFASLPPDAALAGADSLYRGNSGFRDHSIENEPWMYKDMGPNYFYTTGLNLVRLFDKWNVTYKQRLFHQRGLSLEEILMEFSESLEE